MLLLSFFIHIRSKTQVFGIHALYYSQMMMSRRQEMSEGRRIEAGCVLMQWLCNRCHLCPQRLGPRTWGVISPEPNSVSATPPHTPTTHTNASVRLCPIPPAFTRHHHHLIFKPHFGTSISFSLARSRSLAVRSVLFCCSF